MKRVKVPFMALALMITIYTQNALATTTGLPWESPLGKVKDSLTGNTALVIGILIILASGLGLALGEGGGGSKKLLMVIFGLSIAFSAANVVTQLFGGSGCVF